MLKTIAETAAEQRQALYIVGGFVRDLLLKRPSLDFDLVVEGDAIALANALVQKYGGRITTHARFGTAKWFLEAPSISPSANQQTDNHHLPAFLDLITARTEFYTHPTALPTVERGSIKLDLHRRDFTINTLALRLDGLHFGELHDYWGGYNDLRQGVIRVLHSVSFVDDPTRMLRAARFEQRFGFQIAVRTRELIEAALVPQDNTGTTLLDRVSGDRIRHELDHVLDEPKAAAILSRMDALGLLKAIHPALPWHENLVTAIATLPEHIPGPEWGIGNEVKGNPTPRALAYLLWLIELSPAEIGPVAERLKLSQSLETILFAARHLREELPDISTHPPSLITARLDRVHTLGLYTCFLVSKEQTVRACLYQYVTQWRHIHPYTDGNTLQGLGLRPSPVFADILLALRAAWLDGHITSREEEEQLTFQLIEPYKR